MASAFGHTRRHAVSFSLPCRLTERQLLIYRAVRATRKSGKLSLSVAHTHSEHGTVYTHPNTYCGQCSRFVQQLAEDSVCWHIYTKQCERETCTHTHFEGKQLGHMNGQTVVWVRCPTARHGHSVSLGDRREEVWIPQVCKCQWFVHSHTCTRVVLEDCQVNGTTVSLWLHNCLLISWFLSESDAIWITSCFADCCREKHWN